MLFSATASYHTLIPDAQGEFPSQIFAPPFNAPPFYTAQIMPPTTNPARPNTAKPAVSNFTAAPVVVELAGAVLVPLGWVAAVPDAVPDAEVLAEVLLDVELVAAAMIPPR